MSYIDIYELIDDWRVQNYTFERAIHSIWTGCGNSSATALWALTDDEAKYIIEFLNGCSFGMLDPTWNVGSYLHFIKVQTDEKLDLYNCDAVNNYMTVIKLRHG